MTLETATPDGGDESENIDMDALSSDERRAFRARSENMVVVPHSSPDGTCVGMYDVHSQSGEEYTVILDHEQGCDCPDTEYNGADPCKHRRRVAMMITETDCPAPGQQIGDYEETLGEVRRELERERERMLGELSTINSLIDGTDE